MFKYILKFIEHKKFQKYRKINKKWWELHERWLERQNSNKKVVGYGSPSYAAKKQNKNNNSGLKVFNPDE